MSTVNKVILLGRLGTNPELRYTPNQIAVCTLRLATNDRRKGADGEWAEHTEWHNVTVYGKTAENCAQYLQKGRLAYVEGRIQTRKYQDQEGKDKYWTEIIANTVQFIGTSAKENAVEVERIGTQSVNASTPVGEIPNNVVPMSSGQKISFDDDDIPF